MGKTFLLSLFSTVVIALVVTFSASVSSAGPLQVCSKNPESRSSDDQLCPSGYSCMIDPNGKASKTGTRTGLCQPTNSNNSNNGANSKNPGVTDVGACVQEADALLKKCQDEQATAIDSCDSKKDSGMNAVINTASPFALASGANTASSIQAACKGMAGLSQAANAALAAYRLTCNSWIGDCVSSCTEVKKFLKENGNCSTTGGVESVAATNIADEAYDLNRTCTSLNSKVSEADQAIANYTQTALNSSQCASLSSSDDYLAQMCAANPSLIACAALTTVDCTSSTMATNKVCVCAKNPLDPTCSLTTASTANPNSPGNSFLSNTTGSSLDGVASGLGGDLPNIGIEQSPLGKNQAGKDIDGKQGGGAQLGGNGKGGGVAGAGGKGGGGAADANGSQVNAGFYGGGGSGGGFGSGSSYRGNGSGGQAGAVGAKQAGAPDLRQFLPGAKYDPKARGLAGVSGPDGITGPNSSIWQKIQNRYQVMGPSLLP
jgi:hypothetical protein